MKVFCFIDRFVSLGILLLDNSTRSVLVPSILGLQLQILLIITRLDCLHHFKFNFRFFIALPEDTSPMIDKCNLNSGEQIDEETCTVVTQLPYLNITCSINGYFPDISINFQHASQTIEAIATSTLENADQTINKSVTIQASPSSEPYICVLTDIPGPDPVSNIYAKIIIESAQDHSNDSSGATSKYQNKPYIYLDILY